MKPTPRLGGLGIFPAFWFGCSIALVMSSLHSDSTSTFSAWSAMHHDPDYSALMGLFIGGAGMFVLGIVDDLRSLCARHKLLSQIFINAIALHFLPIPQQILGLNVGPIAGAVFVFGWLTVLPNSVNLLDGIDGLTSTLILVFLTAVSTLAVYGGHFAWIFVCASLYGACIAFLRFNWNPARIFLGDSGSLLLGFLVAYMSFYFAVGQNHSGTFQWSPLVSVLLTGVWLLDTVSAIVRRYRNRAPGLRVLVRVKKLEYFYLQLKALLSVFRPDREHIHHKLLQRGLINVEIVVLLSAFLLVSAASGAALYIAGLLEPSSMVYLVVPLLALTGLLIYCHHPHRRDLKIAALELLPDSESSDERIRTVA